jgi:hypothetical protein
MPIDLTQLREKWEHYRDHGSAESVEVLALIDTAEAAIEFHSAYFTGETINLELRRLRETLNHYTTT